jgi:DNA invertase Pin-like site-specific DNA recombinase
MSDMLKATKSRRSRARSTPPTVAPRFVSYLRVSTAKQGITGLGIEAQRDAVSQHIHAAGRDAALLAEYVEQESGRRSDRPQLSRALDHARLAGGVLVIAKLDRLSRDAHFLLGLEKAGVEFVACDLPKATRLTIGVLAVVAQHEREMISERTKAALAVVRGRVAKVGQKKHPKVKRLGNPNGARALRFAARGNVAAITVVRRNADRGAEGYRNTIENLRMDERGRPRSANAIAGALNARGFRSPRGGAWKAQTVIRVMHRLAALSRP